MNYSKKCNNNDGGKDTDHLISIIKILAELRMN